MINEVYTLVQTLDISADDAEEIIDIYFEFYSESKTYTEYLYNYIRTIKQTEENMDLISEIKTIEYVCFLEGDDYVVITNYIELVNDGEIEDCLPNPF